MDFYKQRDFGQLLGAPFIFFGKEIKTILQGLLIFIGPFILIKSVLIGYFGFSPTEDIYTKIQNVGQIKAGTSLFIQILEFFENVMLYSFIGSHIKIFINKEFGNVEIEEIWTEIKRFYWRISGGLILSAIIIVVGLILIIFPGIYFLVALYPLFAIIILEEKSVSKSIYRSFELIKGTWWLTFGLGLVMIIIMTTISALFYHIPGLIFGLTGGRSLQFVLSNFTKSSMDVIVNLFMIIMPFFIYGHIISVKEQPDLIERITDIAENSEIKEVSEPKENNLPEHTKEISESKENRFLNNENTDRFKPKN